MKTLTLKLIATLFVVAAVSATNPALAQRRSTGNNNTESRVEKSERKHIETKYKKSTNEKSAVKAEPRTRTYTNSGVRTNTAPRNESATVNRKSVDARARTEHNRAVYRVNEKDNRYTPTPNFKGSKTLWSVNVTKGHVPYNKREAKYYNNYDHRKYPHWNKSWENYRWSVNSWRDYYSGYHLYSYRFNKHYYYHPQFGHVVRKFEYRPVYFIHNNVKFYNYNGHFFRHFKGVGYVLVDIPYGIVFRQLPAGYDKVFVNGYLYFRVGNLFFERTPHGYSLVHYPERYFALETDFFNGGYYHSASYRLHF